MSKFFAFIGYLATVFAAAAGLLFLLNKFTEKQIEEELEDELSDDFEEELEEDAAVADDEGGEEAPA